MVTTTTTTASAQLEGSHAAVEGAHTAIEAHDVQWLFTSAPGCVHNQTSSITIHFTLASENNRLKKTDV